MSTTYTATAAREGRWWIITVPAVDGVTQARRLADVEQMVRELIAVTLDIPLDEIAVDVDVPKVGDVDVHTELDRIRAERAEASRLEHEASARAEALARNLATHAVPMRDIGTILGVSYQRAHQLANR